MKRLNISNYKQPKDTAYCAPASARSILKYYGFNVSLAELVEDMDSHIKHGTYVNLFLDVLKEFKLRPRKIGFNSFCKAIDRGHPVAVSYKDSNESHLAVLTGYDSDKFIFYINDPYYGRLKIPMGMLKHVYDVDDKWSYEIYA